MRILCGTDIIEIDRIRKSIEKNGDKFLNSVYTAKEIEYCEGRKNAKYNHYAGRFAAKEAIFKAISSTLDSKYEIEWKDIEVKNDQNGRPVVNLDDKFMKNIESIDISISHCKQYAVATVVVLER